MGTWAYSYGFTNSLALGELAIEYLNKGVDATNFRRNFNVQDLFATYSAATPGASWNGSYYVDVQTGVEKTNHVLVYQDTYIFGHGYLNMTDVVVPEKYLTIR